jgi:putative methyltransferase (TIGR04325 family)
LRLAVKAITPPIVWTLLKRAKDALRGAVPAEPAAAPPEPGPQAADAAPPEWEYVPEGWARPAGGWDVEAIAGVYREKWPAFLEAVAGPGPLGVNHEVPLGMPMRRDDLDAQQLVTAFGYVLARTARGAPRLSLLDWGGGPGHYAVLARALLPEVELEYHSRDLPPLVELGRELLPGDTFHSDDSCLDRRYDLVVASSSLQYAPDWRAAAKALAGASSAYLYLTRVPIALGESFVVLQRAYAYGYETEYLGWVISRSELLAVVGAAGLELVRELIFPAWLSAAGAPEDPIGHRGFLFSRMEHGD